MVEQGENSWSAREWKSKFGSENAQFSPIDTKTFAPFKPPKERLRESIKRIASALSAERCMPRGS